MHNHTLFILHILTYDFLRILPFLEIWISVSVVGVGCNLFVVISKNFSSMSPIDRGCPSLPL